MNVNRVAAMVSSTAVGIGIIAAFLLLGSPSEQRLIRLDERRVDHLGRLARSIDGYWHEHDRLPAALEDLVDGRRATRLPRDPGDGAVYGYEVLAGDRYRLCAEFARPTPEEVPENFWSHPSGRHCYQFAMSAGGPDGPPPRSGSPMPIRPLP